METFAPPRRLVDNPRFDVQRARALKKLDLRKIDAPIRDLIGAFAALPYCFTMQSCYGHFVYPEAPALDNLEPLPSHDTGPVTYRIAYIALCLQHSTPADRLLSSLAQIPLIDRDFVQFGSPDWFWERQANSFALQVEPSRFADRDQATIGHAEALHVETIRNQFFARLEDLVASLES